LVSEASEDAVLVGTPSSKDQRPAVPPAARHSEKTSKKRKYRPPAKLSVLRIIEIPLTIQQTCEMNRDNQRESMNKYVLKIANWHNVCKAEKGNVKKNSSIIRGTATLRTKILFFNEKVNPSFISFKIGLTLCLYII
jgi:hypothetical protein